MAGTYNYLKVAKMSLDSSSVLIVAASANSSLKSTILDATNLVANNIVWDNAYDPNPNNDDFYINFPEHPDSTFSSMDVSGTTLLMGAATMGSLTTSVLTTGSVSATTAVVNGTLTGSNGVVIDSLVVEGDLELTGTPVVDTVDVDALTAGSLYFETLDVASENVTVDVSGNVNVIQTLNVQGNSSLPELYTTGNTVIHNNIAILENTCVLKSGYVGQSVAVGNYLQMWDGSGYTDPDGVVVSLSGTQLQTLLNLI